VNRVALLSAIKQLLLLLLLMTFFGLLSVMHGQDACWDLRNYHLYNAYAFIHGRIGWDIAPAMMQSYFNPLLDVFNYSIIMTQTPIITAFIFGSISGITAFLIYQCALILFSNIPISNQKLFYAAIAVILGMSGVAGISQLGTAHNETKIALLIVLSFYSLLCGITKSQRYRFMLAGLIIGLAVGLKLTAVAYAIGLFVGLLWYKKIDKNIFVNVVYFSMSSIIGFLIINGYWMWVLYAHFHNPLFPMMNNIFHSPYAYNLAYDDPRFHFHDWQHFVFFPFYLLKENHLVLEVSFGLMRDWRLAVVYILAIVYGLFWLVQTCSSRHQFVEKITPQGRFLLMAFLVSYVVWMAQYTIYRYAIPLEIYAGLSAVLFISLVNIKNVYKNAFLILVTILVCAMTHYHNWGHIGFREHSNDITIFRQKNFTIVPPVVPHNAVIILLSYSPSTPDPLAYVVPFFPPSVRFIGMNNSLLVPGNQNKLQYIADNMIKNTAEPLYSLTLQQNNHLMQPVLGFYDLHQQQNSCESFTTDFKDQLLLCLLQRNKRGDISR
jgi:hypothetical protein